ncbi:uncharacterized protein LOC124498443 [Dermatophagoides farinae]|uniref:Uncharacterized protein n=1 Tax=Dermatophagoides farinae TaxID=6954 RepID=A0A922ICJ6_DERFA|nr:uncharacterized protein LOC124498443 [Dermatophagoides farinae]KAH7636259.1 hypothetical protein HUG17_10229 [Dermatophagoides farinae]KAH9528313.1 hypothetical protein DERF_002265 [Dermatophagoides farinae]
MNRQINYPSGFKCRKWTLVILISIDLLVLILTTIALVQRNGSGDDINPDDRNTTSKIPTLSQITNAVNTVGENLAKLNITRINVDLGSIDNNSTRQFLDGILNKARENEGQTKWVGQIVAIVIGFIICLIGLIGVFMENYCLSMTYAVITFVGLLYTTVVGIYSEEPILIGKIIMYILFILLVAWFIIDLRAIRRQQKSQNI